MKKAQHFGGEHVSLPHLSGFQLRILVPSRNSGPRHPHHKRHRRAAEGHGQGPLCGRRDTGNNLLTPLSRGEAKVRAGLGETDTLSRSHPHSHHHTCPHSPTRTQGGLSEGLRRERLTGCFGHKPDPSCLDPWFLIYKMIWMGRR